MRKEISFLLLGIIFGLAISGLLFSITRSSTSESVYDNVTEFTINESQEPEIQLVYPNESTFVFDINKSVWGGNSSRNETPWDVGRIVYLK